MPKFDKSPAELEAFFVQAMSAFPQVTLRKTFGYQCAYVNGRMATGLFANSMFVRLSARDEAELLGMPGATHFAPMAADRPMKGYVVLPASMLADSPLLNEWIVRAIENAGSLPPKPAKARKRA